MDSSSDKKGTNSYDRILRENAEQIFMPLIKEYLDFEIKTAIPVKEKLTKTIERETDFLYKVTTQKEKKLLLHIEFQVKNDRKMLLRMAEYHGLIFKKFQLPIHHIVVYLGKAKVNMPNRLEQETIFKGFELISINELETERFLSSQIPEMILLAFMSKYEISETESILRTIIKQLITKVDSELELAKYINQLMILSRLRNLNRTTYKILEDMPLTIDIEKDFLYKKGVKKGIEKGKKLNQIMTVQSMFSNGLSIDQIAKILNMTLQEVEEIIKE